MRCVHRSSRSLPPAKFVRSRCSISGGILSEASQEKKAEPIKDTPPAPEQPAPGAPQAPVVEAAPNAQTDPTVESKPRKRRLPLPRCWISAPPKIKLRERRKKRWKKALQGADGRKAQAWPSGQSQSRQAAHRKAQFSENAG